MLMERIRGDDRRAFGLLLDRYWAPLVGFAGGIVGTRDQAKDVVQDAFIRVWQKRRDWSPTGSVRAYLYRIVRNLSLNECRDRQTAVRRHRQHMEAKVRTGRPRTPAEALESTRLQAEVEAAIASLSPRRREIFVMSRFDGLTHREIAGVLEISSQTVANQMSTALSELRDVLGHLMADA